MRTQQDHRPALVIERGPAGGKYHVLNGTVIGMQDISQHHKMIEFELKHLKLLPF